MPRGAQGAPRGNRKRVKYEFLYICITRRTVKRFDSPALPVYFEDAELPIEELFVNESAEDEPSEPVSNADSTLEVILLMLDLMSLPVDDISSFEHPANTADITSNAEIAAMSLTKPLVFIFITPI